MILLDNPILFIIIVILIALSAVSIIFATIAYLIGKNLGGKFILFPVVIYSVQTLS